MWSAGEVAVPSLPLTPWTPGSPSRPLRSPARHAGRSQGDLSAFPAFMPPPPDLILCKFNEVSLSTKRSFSAFANLSAQRSRTAQACVGPPSVALFPICRSQWIPLGHRCLSGAGLGVRGLKGMDGGQTRGFLRGAFGSDRETGVKISESIFNLG